MKLLCYLVILLIAGLFYPLNEGFSQIKENSSGLSQKIHPTILAWQSSADKETFAKENNLFFKDDKIKVYIYLENPESRFDLPSDIMISSFDGNIVSSLVSSDQINLLQNLEFVQSIGLPILAQKPPIPQIEKTEKETSNNNVYDNGMWIIISGIISVSIIVIIKKYKTTQT